MTDHFGISANSGTGRIFVWPASEFASHKKIWEDCGLSADFWGNFTFLWRPNKIFFSKIHTHLEIVVTTCKEKVNRRLLRYTRRDKHALKQKSPSKN